MVFAAALVMQLRFWRVYVCSGFNNQPLVSFSTQALKAQLNPEDRNASLPMPLMLKKGSLLSQLPAAGQQLQRLQVEGEHE